MRQFFVTYTAQVGIIRTLYDGTHGFTDPYPFVGTIQVRYNTLLILELTLY